MTPKSTTKSQRNGRSRTNSMRRASLALLWVSVGLALASALSISQTTAAMEFVTQIETVSIIQITAGKTLSVLQWLTFSFSTLFAAGVSSIFKKQGGVIESAESTGSGMAMGGGEMTLGDGGVPPAPAPIIL
jgi:hypothetical protein